MRPKRVLFAIISTLCNFLVACGGSNSGVMVAANSRPVADGANYSTSDLVDVTAAVTAMDAEGDSVTFEVTADPVKGTLTAFNGATGEFTYSPDPSQDGVDSFDFTATDGRQSSAAATVTIEIFKWAGTQQFGTAGWEAAGQDDLIVGDDGSITYGGRAQALNNGHLDIWYRKVDRRGNELWSKQFGALVSNSNAGFLENPVGDGFYVLEREIGKVHRFDGDGNETWTRTVDFGSLTMQERIISGGIDRTGNIYAVSLADSSFVVTKISGSAGDVIWQRNYSSSASDPLDPFIVDSDDVVAIGLDFDSSDRPVLVGRFRPTNLTQSRTCTFCPFVASLNTDGDRLWVQEPNSFLSNCSSSNDSGFFFRVEVGSDDSIYAVGSSSTSDVLRGQISKLSADGSNEIWSKCHEGIDSDIGFYTKPLLTVDGGTVVYGREAWFVDRNAGQLDHAEMVLAKYSSTGDFLWRTALPIAKADGTAASVGSGSITGDSQGLIYITVFTDGELTSAASMGSSDVYLMRFDSDGTPR